MRLFHFWRHQTEIQFRSPPHPHSSSCSWLLHQSGGGASPPVMNTVVINYLDLLFTSYTIIYINLYALYHWFLTYSNIYFFEHYFWENSLRTCYIYTAVHSHKVTTIQMLMLLWPRCLQVICALLPHYFIQHDCKEHAVTFLYLHCPLSLTLFCVLAHCQHQTQTLVPQSHCQSHSLVCKHT